MKKIRSNRTCVHVWMTLDMNPVFKNNRKYKTCYCSKCNEKKLEQYE